MKRFVEPLDVSRFHLERFQETAWSLPQISEELSPLIRNLVDERASYGYRRIAALLNWELAQIGHPVAASGSIGS